LGVVKNPLISAAFIDLRQERAQVEAGSAFLTISQWQTKDQDWFMRAKGIEFGPQTMFGNA
jgi:hypothetical protein